MYKEGRSEGRQANYLYSRVLSRQDSVAFPFVIHLAKTMLGHIIGAIAPIMLLPMIPFVPTVFDKLTLLRKGLRLRRRVGRRPATVTNLALASGLQGLRHVMLGAQLCI
jgi:hypothetical protein